MQSPKRTQGERQRRARCACLTKPGVGICGAVLGADKPDSGSKAALTLLGECIVVGSALNETAASAARAASTARSYSEDAQVLVEGPASLSKSSLPRSWPGRKEAESKAVASFAESAFDSELAELSLGMAEGELEIGLSVRPERVLGLLDEVR